MKRRLLPSLLLALALALALTACASKPAAPTAADFEVQPGAYRYQDMGDFCGDGAGAVLPGLGSNHPLRRAGQPELLPPVQ